jgi:UMF1 family MFS transporter
VTAAANSQKAGMAVLVLFFASGLILLTRVKAEAVRARPV